jgi:4-hydroxybenzoyl-CoA reductase subunit beta
MGLPTFKLLRPRSVAEAVDLLNKHSDGAAAPPADAAQNGHAVPMRPGNGESSVEIMAGGTDLLPSLKQRLYAPRHLMEIRGIDELRGIRVRPGVGVEIGALTSLTDIEDSGFIAAHYPVLREAAMTVASPILRNMGTIGGNICLDTRCLWYNQSLQWRKSCGFCIKKDGDLCHVAPGGKKCWAAFSADTPAALLCLNAEIEIAGPRGYRRLAIKDFYSGEGDARMKLEKNELLTRVFLPEASAGYKGTYKKLRMRGSIDYPLAGVAVALKLNGGKVTDARVAITGVNPAPMLVPNSADALLGKAVDEHSAMVVGELAARTAKPLTTSLLTPEYRREMVRVFAKRAVMAAASS